MCIKIKQSAPGATEYKLRPNPIARWKGEIIVSWYLQSDVKVIEQASFNKLPLSRRKGILVKVFDDDLIEYIAFMDRLSATKRNKLEKGHTFLKKKNNWITVSLWFLWVFYPHSKNHSL